MLWQTHSRLLIYSLQHISSLNFLFLARALAEVYARSYALVFWNVEFSPILQKDSCFDVLTWRNESHGKVGVDYKLGAAREFKSSTFAPRYSSPVCVCVFLYMYARSSSHCKPSDFHIQKLIISLFMQTVNAIYLINIGCSK